MAREVHFEKRTRRSAQSRPLRRRLLVVTQGEVTEPVYFEMLKRIHREVVVVVEACPKSPPQMLDTALAIKAKAARSREERYDAVWVVFDTEERPDPAVLRQLRQRADQHGVQLAWSNPCFEVWLTLHLAFSQAQLMTATAAIRQLTALLPSYAKDRRSAERSMATLIPQVATALTNAVRLREGHVTRNAGEFPNPATDVDLLVRSIAQVQAIGSRLTDHP